VLNLAVCDDVEQEMNEVTGIIDRYCAEKNQTVKYDTFLNSLDLVASLQEGNVYDLLIMDVVMPGLNGIEAAKEIRAIDRSVKIIFLTSSPDFALQSYSVGAFYYELKPVRQEHFFHLMDEVTAQIDKEQGESIVVKCKDGLARIPLDQLEYCEVIGKTICFHLASGRELESVGHMEKLSECLARHGGFFRVHRSYEINMDYITNISYKSAALASGKEIPLPRGKYSEIKDAFLDRALKKGWESA